MGADPLPVQHERRIAEETANHVSDKDHLPKLKPLTKKMITMKTKYEVRLPVRLGPEWDFSLWFALLSPLIGILLGFFGGFLLYH